MKALAIRSARGHRRPRRGLARRRSLSPMLLEEFVPAELAGMDLAELPTGDLDMQLAAHGPDGDGVIAAVGAEAQALSFAEEPEPAIAPAELDVDDEPDWTE